MGVARGQASRGIGSPRTGRQQPGFRSGWIRRSTSICGGRRRLEAQHREAVGREADLKSDNEELRARVREFRLYGRRSERRVGEGKSPSRGPVGRALADSSRGSGDMGEAKGLEAREEVADCPKSSRSVPAAAGAWIRFRGPTRPRRSRVFDPTKRYHPSDCGVLPGIVTAPSPARLIPRGKLGISVWVRVILDKYLYSRPSHRLLQELADQGVRLSPGTIAGGLGNCSRCWSPCGRPSAADN